MKILKSILLICVLFGLSGCVIKKDEFDGIDIYATIYTIEYITDYLYGDYSTIKSIYPDGVNLNEYTITNKKINDFSKGDLFIYNGLSSEKQIAVSLINKNKKMNIIDVSQGLEIKNEAAELWISPSNTLMVAQNIKNGLKEYISNKSILENIDSNYEDLKIEISELDAELKLVAENATNKKIVVSGSSFSFLSKYGFDVINISNDDDEVSSTALSKAKKAFSSKENTYLFVLKGAEETDNIKSLTSNGATLVNINSMTNLTDEERINGDDYISFMKAFIDAIKAEVY